jgi:hypothetical protein
MVKDYYVTYMSNSHNNSKKDTIDLIRFCQDRLKDSIAPSAMLILKDENTIDSDMPLESDTSTEMVNEEDAIIEDGLPQNVDASINSNGQNIIKYQKDSINSSEGMIFIFPILHKMLFGNTTDAHSQIDSIIGYLHYLLLLDTLSNTAHSYERMLKMAENAGDLLQSQSARNAVNTIASSIRRYSTIDEKQDRISLDVGSMIVDLYKRYSDRSNKTWIYISPYFTVGINGAGFSDSMASLKNEAGLSSFTHYSFSNVFASEKIGIKWKIWNYKYRASFDEGDEYSYYGKRTIAEEERYDPLLSDIHAILYASGILYNLVDVKTKKDFTAPLFGISFGGTFFNGLDINIGGGIDYENESRKRTFLSASFDVDIVEYIKQLSNRLSK